ncbi:MAG: AbrB/MazE/SpoVT family DNA-binding domain-containing protein [Thaumarchaeota archaeon]|nr:AbrB/MazE/SpoVT family DNA-binding domain-containing protein [Nitrososphaerota archaeon]
MVMEEKIIERRMQLNRGSFILTIPRTIAEMAGIHKGQSVRFRVRDGEIVISPLSVLGDSTPGSADSDKYARAVAEMMAKGRSEKPGGRGTAAGKSKLERLRLK